MTKQICTAGLSLILALVLAASLTPVAAIAGSGDSRTVPVLGLIDAAPATINPAPRTTPKPDSGSTTAPKTSDEGNIMLHSIVVVLSGIALWLLWRKKDEQDEAIPL